MGKGFLIDSNSIIDFFNNALPEKGKNLLLNLQPQISIITQIEIFSKKHLPEEEISKLRAFLKIVKIYILDETIANKTIEIRINHAIKLPDAIIAATALHHNLILITRNISDFQKINGLEVINPHTV